MPCKLNRLFHRLAEEPIRSASSQVQQNYRLATSSEISSTPEASVISAVKPHPAIEPISANHTHSAEYPRPIDPHISVPRAGRNVPGNRSNIPVVVSHPIADTVTNPAILANDRPFKPTSVLRAISTFHASPAALNPSAKLLRSSVGSRRASHQQSSNQCHTNRQLTSRVPQCVSHSNLPSVQRSGLRN
jgi:hypothetical protein